MGENFEKLSQEDQKFLNQLVENSRSAIERDMGTQALNDFAPVLEGQKEMFSDSTMLQLKKEEVQECKDSQGTPGISPNQCDGGDPEHGLKVQRARQARANSI